MDALEELQQQEMSELRERVEMLEFKIKHLENLMQGQERTEQAQSINFNFV